MLALYIYFELFLEMIVLKFALTAGVIDEVLDYPILVIRLHRTNQWFRCFGIERIVTNYWSSISNYRNGYKKLCKEWLNGIKWYELFPFVFFTMSWNNQKIKLEICSLKYCFWLLYIPSTGSLEGFQGVIVERWQDQKTLGVLLTLT